MFAKGTKLNVTQNQRQIEHLASVVITNLGEVPSALCEVTKLVKVVESPYCETFKSTLLT